jgi:cytochrome P450
MLLKQRISSLYECPFFCHFSDDFIAWTLADLFMAGAETSSTTLSWFFLYMVEFPDVQKRIQEEIDAVVGRDRLPNWNDKAR